MKITDFEKELKAIDERLAIVPNMRRPVNEDNRFAISNIMLGGKDVCPIPSEDIKDEEDNSYRYMFPNGMSQRFKTRPEALAMVENVLRLIKTPEGNDQFFDRN